MEFWKRKKSTTPTSASSSSINPATISEPIHNLDTPGSSLSTRGTTPPPSFATTTRSPMHAPDLAAGFGDAEFRERYKSYRQQRRLSHTNSSSARSSQLTTASENTVVSQPDMARQRSHDSDSMSVMDEPSGPPRGSLRSTRSTAHGRAPAASDTAHPARATSMGTPRPAPFMPGTASSMSVATTHSMGSSSVSRRSAMSAHSGVSGANEPDPDGFSAEEINLMLGRLMDEMDIKDAQRLQMQKMSLPNKLKLLKQQRQLESFQVDSKGNAP
ncbi:hypothetical protein GGF43_005113, partial [Coemansia sp. RSA 2618]